MKIGIIVAMDKEFNQLESIIANKKTSQINNQRLVEGTVGDKHVILQKCGIGKVNSAIGTVEMIKRFSPNIIISSGCAGGVGIIVAMDKEFNQLESIIANKKTSQINNQRLVEGTVGDKHVILQKCGIGKVNSAIGTVEMIKRFSPNIIISSGCAGGADASLNMFDVVVANNCVYHDAYCGKEVAKGQIMGMPARYTANKQLVEKVLSLNTKDNNKNNIKAGLTVTGDWFVDNKQTMKRILSDFPEAMAVDMESCSIAQVCYIYSVPFLSFRVISDVPLKDNSANMYYDFWDRIAENSFEVTKDLINLL